MSRSWCGDNVDGRKNKVIKRPKKKKKKKWRKKGLLWPEAEYEIHWALQSANHPVRYYCTIKRSKIKTPLFYSMYVYNGAVDKRVTTTKDYPTREVSPRINVAYQAFDSTISDRDRQVFYSNKERLESEQDVG
jgi:hypothetical protein